MNESQRPCQQTHHHERYVIIYVIIHITIHVNWLFNPWWNLWRLFSSQTLGLGWATRAQCQSMTFFELSNNGKQASQISDTVMIVTKFVTKKIYFCRSIHFMTHIRRRMHFRLLSVTKCKTSWMKFLMSGIYLRLLGRLRRRYCSVTVSFWWVVLVVVR